MRALALGLLVLVAGCRLQATARDVCEEALNRIERCGATVPTLRDRPCSGLAKEVSTCITEHTTDCDSLATLPGRLDECVPDAGDDFLPEAEELPFPFTPDAGRADGGP